MKDKLHDNLRGRELEKQRTRKVKKEKRSNNNKHRCKIEEKEGPKL